MSSKHPLLSALRLFPSSSSLEAPEAFITYWANCAVRYWLWTWVSM